MLDLFATFVKSMQLLLEVGLSLMLSFCQLLGLPISEIWCSFRFAVPIIKACFSKLYSTEDTDRPTTVTSLQNHVSMDDDEKISTVERKTCLLR